MRLKLFIIIIFIFYMQDFVCQKNVEYHYIIKNKGIVDSATNYYPYKNMEFSVTRLNFNDSIFKEFGLFEKTMFLKKPPLFKIINSKWYILDEKKYKIFYPILDKKTLKLNQVKYVFENVKDTFLNQLKCTVFTVRPEKVGISTIVRHYFNEKYGVIMVNIDGIDLIRDDLKW